MWLRLSFFSPGGKSKRFWKSIMAHPRKLLTPQDTTPEDGSQVILEHAETGQNFAIDLPPLPLAGKGEAALLRAYAFLLETKYDDNIPGNQHISDIIGKSISYVNGALRGGPDAPHIGDEAWLKLEQAADWYGYTEWFKRRRGLK